eukprot:759433-Hanusia_phi.AAC.2
MEVPGPVQADPLHELHSVVFWAVQGSRHGRELLPALLAIPRVSHVLELLVQAEVAARPRLLASMWQDAQLCGLHYTPSSLRPPGPSAPPVSLQEVEHKLAHGQVQSLVHAHDVVEPLGHAPVLGLHSPLQHVDPRLDRLGQRHPPLRRRALPALLAGLWCVGLVELQGAVPPLAEGDVQGGAEELGENLLAPFQLPVLEFVVDRQLEAIESRQVHLDRHQQLARVLVFHRPDGCNHLHLRQHSSQQRAAGASSSALALSVLAPSF